MERPPTRENLAGDYEHYKNVCSLSLQFGLAKLIKIINNDNTKKVAKFQN